MEDAHSLSFSRALPWIVGYFGVMLLYTAIDMFFLRDLGPSLSGWLNLGTMFLASVGFVKLMTRKTRYRIDILNGVTIPSVLLALLGAILLYFLLDKFLDPIFESFFSASEMEYQYTLSTLADEPVVTFLHICILAPFIEEIIMRGFLMGGLRSSMGVMQALLISSALFALLHFNMVQTLSALVCGLILGILYLRTGSILCCMIAHCGYNMISYFTVIVPLIGSL